MKEMKQMNEFIESIITLSNAASNDHIRYMLCGVHVEQIDGKLKLKACDGHILAERFAEQEIEGFVKPIIISTDSIKLLKSFYRTNKKMPFVFKMRDRFLDVSCFGQSLSLETIDAEYPNTDRTKPNFETHLKVSFNPSLLYDLCEALRSGKGDKVATLEFSSDKLVPIKVSFGGNNGILMPCRGE
jgi:DNA polymerase III sliding clamp (beta) subunit (PCNA family)